MTSEATFPCPDALMRIRRIGQIGRVITLAGIAFVVAGAVWVWGDTSIIERAARAHLGLGDGAVVLTTRILLLTFVLSLLPLALLLYGMSTVAQLFHSFARGRVFSVENASRISRIGWTFIAAGLATSPLRTLIGLVLTLDNLPGYRTLTVAFGLETLTYVLVGAGLLAIATVVREAVRLHDEHQQFI